jgi:hypothetical protein
MKTTTWAPGTDVALDQLFDDLREQQYQDCSHRLWKNYSKENFNSAVALTICFNDLDEPEMCSSISSRECWPSGAYRILNRLWKHSNKIAYPRVMSNSFGSSAQSQIDWLKSNVDCQLYFISRQTDNWEQWCINNFFDRFNLEFKTDNYKYLTCPNECDDTCWQKIIYNGNKSILSQWKKLQ